MACCEMPMLKELCTKVLKKINNGEAGFADEVRRREPPISQPQPLPSARERNQFRRAHLSPRAYR